jgi:PIN domain nuclease of toxin-antitoxin system
MVLLDTCAVIWMAEEVPMASLALSAIRQAAAVESLLVSPVSAWEIGLLATRRRQPLTFRPTPVMWIERLMARGPVSGQRCCRIERPSTPLLSLVNCTGTRRIAC